MYQLFHIFNHFSHRDSRSTVDLPVWRWPKYVWLCCTNIPTT